MRRVDGQVRRAADTTPDPAPLRGLAPRRVLMIAYHFPPATEIGAYACAQIARYVSRYNWEPVILTVAERHLEHVDRRNAEPVAGSVIRTGVIPHPLDVYRRSKSLLSRASAGASTGSAPPPNPATLRSLVLSFLVTPDEYTGWFLPSVLKGLRTVRGYKVSCLFSSGPYWTNHLVGSALAQLTGRPWVAHFRDPWTQARRAKPVSSWSVRINAALERMVMHRASAVVCVAPQHTALLQAAYPELPRGKFITIPNGFDGAEWKAVSLAAQDRKAPTNKFVIRYAGNLYPGQNPQPLFRALESLINIGEVSRPRLQIDLIGNCTMADGVPVAQMAAEHGLAGCVNITGHLTREEVLPRVADADLLLLLAEQLSLQIPSKTYEYLRAGRPILALAPPESAVVDLLRKTGGAWVVDPANTVGIAAAVREAYQCWKERRQDRVPDPAIVKQYDRCVLAGRLAGVFNDVCARSGRGAAMPSRATNDGDDCAIVV